MRKVLLYSLIFLTGPLLAQINHDFDSLIVNNAEYAEVMKSTLSKIDLFDSEEPMIVRLEADFRKIQKNRFDDEYHPAVIRYPVSDTVTINREIKVKPRGNMRLKTCNFPPLKINFPKKKVFIEQLQEFDKMKMVGNCKRGSQYQQYLLSEYYAYKVYNALSPFSLRVRLIELTYFDTKSEKSLTQYAFIIEDIDLLAKRSNAVATEMKYVKDKMMNVESITNMYLFQYMIGNTDWSVYARHNVDLLIPKEPEGAKPVAIPFDFDYAGIVGTPYAVPSDQLDIETVRERIYRGFCDMNQELPVSLAHHQATKEDVMSVYENSRLDPKIKKKTIHYLNQYYKIIESEGKTKSLIYNSCRTR